MDDFYNEIYTKEFYARLDAIKTKNSNDYKNKVIMTTMPIALVFVGVIVSKFMVKLVLHLIGKPEQTQSMSPQEEKALINRYLKERQILLNKHKDVYDTVKSDSKISRIFASALTIIPGKMIIGLVKYTLMVGIMGIIVKIHDAVLIHYKQPERMMLKGHDVTRLNTKSYLLGIVIALLFTFLDKLIVYYKTKKVGVDTSELLDISRAKTIDNFPKRPVKSPKDIYNILYKAVGKTPYEVFYLIYLDTNNVPQHIVYSTSGQFSSLDLQSINAAIKGKFLKKPIVTVVGVHNHPPHNKELGFASKTDIVFSDTITSLMNKQKLFVKEYYVYAHGIGASSYYRKPQYYSAIGLSINDVIDKAHEYWGKPPFNASVDWDFLKRLQLIK